ncbi:LamB/YcsF family protein [Klebsiella pneumoniae]|nr:LamB/YcsF family protein [Klebsiella pneumoniae]
MRARGAGKTRAAIGAHLELPGPGKFRSNRDAVTARDGLTRPGAVPNWRAGGTVHARGELRHVKPHGMLYNRAAKEPLWPTLSSVVRDADADLCWLGWRAASLSAPDSIIS